MKHDVEWFKRKVSETPERSQRKLAPTILNSEGRPMDPSSLNKIVNGTQPMFLSDAVQLARVFGVSLEEVAKRSGLRL